MNIIKKLLAIILIAIMLMAVALTPAFACGTCAEEGSCEELFIERYSDMSDHITYEEVYYYDNPYSDNYTDDWILIKASLNFSTGLKVKELIGDRVILGEEDFPFRYGYAIFDYKSGGSFQELDSSCLMLYDGLMEVLHEINIGIPVGDADFDNELTVLDATYIQLAIAQLVELNELDDISGYCADVPAGYNTINHISDITMDGTVNILDATKIQKKLAGFDNINTDDIIVGS